jgi:hypothetical protein
MPTTINIASGDYTHGIQKRDLRKLNIGFYCDCGEFVAFAVTEPRLEKEIAFACDGPLLFLCPFCQEMQKRVVTEFHTLVLTEANKRRPPLARVTALGSS